MAIKSTRQLAGVDILPALSVDMANIYFVLFKFTPEILRSTGALSVREVV